MPPAPPDRSAPRPPITHLVHDLLGRATRVIEAYTDGVPTATTNKRVESTYDGIGNVLTLKVALPGGGRQTTGYVHGVGPASGSAIASNDLLAEVRRPDKATGLPSAAEAETFTSNALGERTSATDRNGTTRVFTHDVLGRLVADAVTTLGAGVDGAVRRLQTAYDVAGRPTLLTSFDAVSGGAVVNQIRRDYNGLGQLVAEYQAHAGAVNTGTTPKVQYAYGELAGGANHSRLLSLTYPDGRVLHHGYAAGPDDAISRVTSLADDDGLGGPGPVLERYDYLGLGTIVARSRPQPGIELTYVKRPGEAAGDAGDPYTGLDRFGRVVDQRWLDSATGTAVDRHAHGHDRGGNRLYRANLLDAAFDELYAYDATNQLASYARGVLSDADSDGVPDTVANPSRTQSWDLDAPGNWDEVTTDGTPEGRTHNAQNQLTGVGAATLSYDANGNLTTDEAGRTFTYDAWNRPVAVADAGGNPLVAHAHDALDRRITADDGTARRFYYSADWRVLEERVAGAAAAQYVWGPGYVDALVLRDRGAERLYALQDANWNVTALVDAGGAVVERYAYDPYGAAMVLAGDWTARGTSAYDWIDLHQGGRYDGASGLYHFRNRDYSPALGRWTQEDPIGFAAGDSNPYRYVFNNVPNNVDPSGLEVYLRPFPTNRPWWAGGGSNHVHLEILVWDPDNNIGCVFNGGGGHNPIGTQDGPYSYPPFGIKIDTGLTYEEEIERISAAYHQLTQIKKYQYRYGPNSNIYAHQLLILSGIPGVPIHIPDAPGWSNPGQYYGGTVQQGCFTYHYDAYGNSTGVEGPWMLPPPPNRPSMPWRNDDGTIDPNKLAPMM